MTTATKQIIPRETNGNGKSTEAPRSVFLEINVTDQDSVQELVAHSSGRDRDEYAVGALRVGLLSFKHARGQMDADNVRHEGERMISEMGIKLDAYRSQLTDGVTNVLKEYFDPTNGQFPQRVEKLLSKDGELERVLRGQIGSDGSTMAIALAAHVGKDSPLMNLLDPAESGGLVNTIRISAERVLQAESDRILAEFSLDNKDGAVSRMVLELTEKNGQLSGDLTSKIDEAVKEFSLDKEDSALSRLLRRVETAQKTISNEFSLDNSESALARLKKELLGVLNVQNEQNETFQREVTSALEAMKARRAESMRSTIHGIDFEAEVVAFVRCEAEKAGDIPTHTGTTTGEIAGRKYGDAIVELGPDCVAHGVKFVIEAKKAAGYDLRQARAEIELARKNRGAAVGVFVFSKAAAPQAQEAILRIGNDVFVIWDADDQSSDVILKTALSLAKALCVRESTARGAEAAQFEAMDKSILAIEREARRLDEMRKWTETIKSNSGKILEEVRKMAEGLEAQVGLLKDAMAGLESQSATV